MFTWKHTNRTRMRLGIPNAGLWLAFNLCSCVFRLGVQSDAEKQGKAKQWKNENGIADELKKGRTAFVKRFDLWGQNVRNLCSWHVGRYIRIGKPTWLLPKISFWLAAAFYHLEKLSACPSFQIFHHFYQGKTFYNTFVELDVWI